MSVQLASVVLPVYNQADHIASVLEEYITSLKRLDFESELLPVINGKLRDNSLAVCQSLEKKYPVIRTFAIEAGGWGRAVRYGLQNTRGDLICYTNSARTTGKD